MRIGLVSGDGLPVSGLLTVFRNVLNLGVGMGIVDPYVPADLGFSWRPDKPSFFPDGQGEIHAPSWMQVAPHYIRADSRELALALTRLRNGIAEFESASPGDKAALKTSFATLQSMYYKQFTRWLDEIAVDWIFAVNMTLPDAAPATAALHEAAGRYFSAKESGGVVFWDHDLFGSCAVPNSDTGGRLYPPTPNELLPCRGRVTRIGGSLSPVHWSTKDLDIRLTCRRSRFQTWSRVVGRAPCRPATLSFWRKMTCSLQGQFF